MKFKAILIDPYAKDVREVEVEPGIKGIYAAMSVPEHPIDIVEAVYPGGAYKQDSIYVDEEGLFKLANAAMFQPVGYPQPLVGPGLVLGCDDEGNSIAPTVTVEQVRANVKFMSVEEVRLAASMGAYD